MDNSTVTISLSTDPAVNETALRELWTRLAADGVVVEQARAPSLETLQARALELLGAAIDLQIKNVTYSDPDAERAARLAIDLARAVGAV